MRFYFKALNNSKPVFYSHTGSSNTHLILFQYVQLCIKYLSHRCIGKTLNQIIIEISKAAVLKEVMFDATWELIKRYYTHGICHLLFELTNN